MTRPIDIETIAGPFELKKLTADGVLEGYGSVFGIRDSFDDIVEKGAFKRSLKEDPTPAFLWQHDTGRPIGVFTEMSEDAKGLFVRGRFTKGVAQADEARRLLQDGALNGLSIGFSVRPDGAERDAETGIRHITDVKLFEVSLVTFPANLASRVTAVKGDNIKSERELERLLRDVGMPGGFAKLVVATVSKKHNPSLTDGKPGTRGKTLLLRYGARRGF